jgi:hypothetical protein
MRINIEARTIGIIIFGDVFPILVMEQTTIIRIPSTAAGAIFQSCHSSYDFLATLDNCFVFFWICDLVVVDRTKGINEAALFFCFQAE